MQRKWICCLWVVVAGLTLAGCGGNGETENPKTSAAVTETGTSMAGASVVRSAVLTVSGAVSGKLEAPKDETTVLRGNCPPDMWANFGIQFNAPGYTWIAVTIMTKDPIPAGYTGPVKLDWVDVSFFDNAMKSLYFKGSGTFEITTHNAAAKDRRMTGVIKGTGLKGRDDAEGKTLDAEFGFDINFSCGVK